MATDDVTSIDSKCFCGNGTIRVTITSPDHPWARESQTSYSATLNCAECSKIYAVISDGWNAKPSLVLRSEIEAQAKAHENYTLAERRFFESPQLKNLLPLVIEWIDSQPSKAARHRLLKRLGLVYVEYGAYNRWPFGGEEAVRHASAITLAEIGAEQNLAPRADVDFFKQVARELRQLQDTQTALAPRPVKTGATGMSR